MATDGPPPSTPKAPPSLRDRLLRRGLKLAGLAAFAYYLLPRKVLGQPVYWAFPLGAAIVVAVELARLAFHLEIPAIRPYERRRPAAYVYWSAALGLLIAFFPEGVAIAALAAAAVADILVGELRTTGTLSGPRTRPVGFLAYLCVAAPLLAGLGTEPWALALLLGAFGAVLAILVEGHRFPSLDDDLLMPLVPALTWLALTWVVPGAVPLAFHWPWLSRG